MSIGRPKPKLIVSDDDRATLMRWTARPKTSQALALRARIVLESATGITNTEVATRLGVTKPTVGKWRNRFVAKGPAGLLDEPRVGAPRTLGDEDVERVITQTLEATPPDATHWSVRSMAQASGVSPTSVHRIWRAFALQPHRSEFFKLSNDPQFIEKVRDIVGLYLNPPERAVVLCTDEKSQIQALDRTQPVLPMMPGMPERRTHDYLRHGITSLFAAFNIADGTVISQLHRRHRAIEFRKFLTAIDKAVPAGLDVHLVCDNYVTHNTAQIKTWLARHPRFYVHFTPTGSSWMNQVERCFGLLTDKLIRRGVHTSVQALENVIRAWIATWNQNPRPFTWTKTADEILNSLADYLAKVGAGHPGNRQT